MHPHPPSQFLTSQHVLCVVWSLSEPKLGFNLADNRIMEPLLQMLAPTGWYVAIFLVLFSLSMRQLTIKFLEYPWIFVLRSIELCGSVLLYVHM
jgi:hypothetical protein